MLTLTSKGLYCPAGDFYIDPQGAVPHAVITHAHSDHARRGSKQYYCVQSGVSLLKTRLGASIEVQAYPYGETFYFRDVALSFHPAGHILGSSQIRLVFNQEVWVVSGDYKREYDLSCEPFEIVPCDVFVTEATFGAPFYCWEKQVDFGANIFDWWQQNAKFGFNSLLFAYSLGKAQRILASLKNYAQKPIYCHPATFAMNQCYEQQGVNLANYRCLTALPAGDSLHGDLVIAPMGFLKTPHAIKLGRRFKTAVASGWQARQFSSGFVMSDHADWQDLLQTVFDSKAKRIFVQHKAQALIKTLKMHQLEAYADTKLCPKNPAQLSFI